MKTKHRIVSVLMILALLSSVTAVMVPLAGAAVVEPAEDQIVIFPDPNLEAAIRKALGIDPDVNIYRSDLEGLTTLRASYRGIVDLSGIEYCINLTKLGLEWNQISDISPLSNLTNLTWLWLRRNQISDISPLSNLTNLTVLALGDNQISDISLLSGLTNLTRLVVRNNQISDISPLSGLTNLTTLWAYGNQISDISPLSGLTNLTDLWLGDNQISDISPLSGLTNLTLLELRDNRISDISPLVQNEGLSEGDRITLRGNPLSYVSIYTYIPQLKARGVHVVYDPTPESITITPDTAKVSVDRTQQFTVTVRPRGACQRVIWSTTNAAIGTIDANGLFIAIAEGTVTVIATNVRDANIIGSATVTVLPLPTNIVVNPATVTLNVDATQQFSAIVYPATADQGVNWSVDNEVIGTIDEYGLFRAIELGTVTVTATSVVDETIIGTATVRVVVVEAIMYVQDHEQDQLIRSGDRVRFLASIYGFDGTNISFHWDFGDGTTAEGKTSEHRFRGVQNYCKEYIVTLTVTCNNKGYTVTDEVEITVKPLEKTIGFSGYYIIWVKVLPLTVEYFARMTVLYNWVGFDIINQNDIFIVSRITSEAQGYHGVFMPRIVRMDHLLGTIIWQDVRWIFGPPLMPVGRSITKVYDSPDFTTDIFTDADSISLTFHADTPYEATFEGIKVRCFDRMAIKGSGHPIGIRMVSTDFCPYAPRVVDCPILKGLSDVLMGILKSPGEFRVYDYQGRVTGLVDGVVKQEIPYSMFDKENNVIVILSPTEGYRFVVVGTDDADYGLTVVSVTEGAVGTFTLTDIPTAPGAVHQFTVDWDALDKGEKGITMKIDSEGDGVFEEVTHLRGEQIILLTSITVSPQTATIEIGETQGFAATLYPYPGDADQTVTWSVENPDIGTIDADGLFTGLAAGTTTITATSDAHPEITGTATVTVEEPPPTIQGDVNRDGKVDAADLALVAAALNSRPGMPNWNPGADLNQDGIVDILDLVKVGRNFGKSSSPWD